MPVMFLALTTSFIACDSQKSSMNSNANPNADDLYKFRWHLSEINNAPAKLNEDNPAYLQFSKNKSANLTGFTGCNRLTGTLDLSTPGKIKLSPLAVTEMACIGENSEPAFLEALKKTSEWRIENNQLLLTDGSSILARFNAVGAGDVKLNGTWELNYITGPRIAFEGLYPTKKPTLIFNFPSIEVSGNTSCNGFGAKVTIEGTDKISFGNMLSTMMACPGNGEQTFVKAMKQANRYALTSENSLSLYDGNLELMRFTRK